MVKYKLDNKILCYHGKSPLLNDETTLIWVGWAHCLDYAEAATTGVLWKSCSEEFHYIYVKTPMLEFLFNKVTGL